MHTETGVVQVFADLAGPGHERGLPWCRACQISGQALVAQARRVTVRANKAQVQRIWSAVSLMAVTPSMKRHKTLHRTPARRVWFKFSRSEQVTTLPGRFTVTPSLSSGQALSGSEGKSCGSKLPAKGRCFTGQEILHCSGTTPDPSGSSRSE